MKKSLVILLTCLIAALFCLSGCDPDDARFDILPNEYHEELLNDSR